MPSLARSTPISVMVSATARSTEFWLAVLLAAVMTTSENAVIPSSSTMMTTASRAEPRSLRVLIRLPPVSPFGQFLSATVVV